MAKAGVAQTAVAIGGSAGSLEAILQILPQLSPTSGAAFIFVLHRRTETEHLLTDIFQRRTNMPVQEVEDKDLLSANTVFIAPPDYHLLIEDGRAFSLDTSEKILHSRPSIDVTFESVAEHFGPRAIGVLLSGANADGAEGLMKIRSAGGATIVQDPEDAEVAFMPQRAINLDAACAMLPAAKIGARINELLEKT